MRSISYLVALTVAILTSSLPSSAPAAAIIKLSNSGICHTQNSAFYSRTKSFKAFDSLSECLKHGRNPRTAGSTNPTPVAQITYDRSAFGGWADTDGDCMNTRHELLQELSTSATRRASSGCTIQQGRWLDPYTGKTFHNARDLDVDHLVPLAYAWSHGADRWPESKRVQFANDPRNLFPVQASVNRQKGAKGPLAWLPPNQRFHCQYMLRFLRISQQYNLLFTADEEGRLSDLRKAVCKK